MTLTGYHTLEDRENPDQIERFGPYPCAGEQAFLGMGCYFWEEDLQLGHWWGKHHCNNSYVICQGIIDCRNDGSFLDLVAGVKDKKFLKEEIPARFAADLKRKFGTNNVPIGLLIEYLKELENRPEMRGIFPFKVIRAIDYQSVKSTQFTEGKMNFTFLGGKQILCIIRDVKLFLSDFRIIYPSKYVN